MCVIRTHEPNHILCALFDTLPLSLSQKHLLLLGHGDGLDVRGNSSKPLRFVLAGGEPLGEPVAHLRPFVMNTEEEIDQAIDDYQYCINGFEKAKHWKSEAMVELEV